MALPGIYRRLEYEPSLVVDNLMHTARARYLSYKPTLGLNPATGEFYIHGNSIVIPRENSIDVHQGYQLFRLFRHWEAQLHPQSLQVISPYIMRTKSPDGWDWDYHIADWRDAPGVVIKRGNQPSQRDFQEFVIFVGQLRGDDETPTLAFGGLYYIVVYDSTPKKYRVLMSLATPLTPEQIDLVVRKRQFPSSLVNPKAPPNFASFRYVPNHWHDYSKRVGHAPDDDDY